MAVFYKGQRVFWTIPGIDPNSNINLDPATFHPEMLPEGRILQGSHGKPLYRIPTIPGRISIRSDGYVEFILSRHYDKETKQSRNKKVIIGNDASDLLPGMMVPNDNYYNLFDYRGRLFHNPENEDAQQEDKEEQQEEQIKETEPIPEPSKPTSQTNQHQPRDQQIKQIPTTQPTKTQVEETPTDKEKEEFLKQRERAIKEKEQELRRREQELQAWQQELEAAEDKLLIKAQEADEDHIKLLSYILSHYMDIIKPQASRKPAVPLSRKQIQTINELLRELKAFFAGSEMDSYLHLAEEPEPDHNNPGTTNGEMALILGVYEHTLNAFRYGELRKSKKP